MDNVSPFRPKDAEPSVLEQQLRASLDVTPLVNSVFWHDMKLGRIEQLTRMSDLTPEQRSAIYDRAVVAMNLGDPSMVDAMIENGARAAKRGLVGRELAGAITELHTLNLDDLRLLAGLIVGGALAHLKGNPPVPIEDTEPVQENA